MTTFMAALSTREFVFFESARTGRRETLSVNKRLINNKTMRIGKRKAAYEMENYISAVNNRISQLIITYF
uniref:Transposase n=1 Tax=Heterorhabditis bacteriophora TaxID=37862 RepID=A0A1I7X340_HETBA